jgi:arylsulfatase A-like enzyme
MTLRRLLQLATLAGVVALATSVTQAADTTAKRPNILLIVADDMGYTDIGSYGGEIKTPNLDALAARGVKATNYYVGPTCSPTRSMMFSGVDNHVAGLGNMHEYLGPQQKGKPGYEGHLNDRVASMAQVLHDGGYHTYMAGKWHLGEEPAAWPAAKGFERDFTLMQGGGSNWDDMAYPNPSHPNLTFSLNGKPLDKLPRGHFSTQAFTDFIIKSVDQQKADGKPFFAYLSYQAVHSQYDQGYEALRAARTARMKEMGLVAKDAASFPRLPQVPAWDKLTPEQKKVMARRMEVYAAMLENMDSHIGRVLDHLKQNGQLDNTLVIFMSDNGAEPLELLELAQKVDPRMRTWLEKNWDTRPEACGRPKSVCDYGPAWAQAGSGPYRFFKGWVAEGGIKVPFIVAGPGVKPSGDKTDALLHVTDIAPTLFEVAGVQHPSATNKKLAPLAGKSMLPVLSGKADGVRGDKDWLGWELFGNRAIRQGDWKLVSIVKPAGGSGDWQLFNLRADPGETRDLAKAQPAKRAELLAHWDEYAKKNGVILTDDGPFRAGKKPADAVADH